MESGCLSCRMEKIITMKKIFIIIGVILSIAATGQINQSPSGRTLLDYKRVGNTLYINYSKYGTSPLEYSENYSGVIYYFAASGSDSNDGLTKSTPKQTLAAASALSLNPGDAVLFNSTDIYEGTLTVQSGATYGAYGVQSSKPTILGSDEIAGWTVHSGNIYKASFATDINQLFVDGERLLASREPLS